MGYLEFYGLEQEPFSNAPVSKFYFNSEQHVQALLRLRRVADQMKGLAILVGDVGAGKTTLARKMLDSLSEDQYEAALLVIIHSGISAHWLLRRIAQQLGVQNPAEEKLQLLSQLYRRLLQIADQGRKAVVLIDEAQMLQTRELMEEFRGLLNLEIPERKLITFIFFGLPEIEENMKLDPPLLQRVTLKWRLDSMSETSSRKYVEHRLALAGARKPIFSDGAMDAIYRFSHGIPRLINTIADNALFEGYILKADAIPQEVIENIAVDLGLSPYRKRELRVVNTIEALEGFDEEPKGFEDAPDEPTAKQFEREAPNQDQDIDAILSGLDDKL
ncbi:MAG: AAA family ATPase [Pseudomonadota bacterium]